MNRTLTVGLLSAALFSTASYAAQPRIGNADGNDIEEIIVYAHPLSAEGLAQAALALEEGELSRNLSSNIAETLARQPGIHNSSFGTAAGRPVIRGLGGPRVRLMEDRLETLDVSVTSADHATSVDALVADRIEVLKGPSTLLYGSGAIGGVVDVHTGRIPHAAQDRPTGALEVRGEDATEQLSTAGELDFGGGPLAFHVDGFYRDAEDYEIPGCTESDALRAEEGGEPCEVDGKLPGSWLETWGGAVGASWVGERGFAGFAISRYDNEYGLPGGHAHEEGEEEEEEEEGTPFIELEQTRYDFEAGLEDPLPGFTSLNLRVVYNDYEHAEIEPSGEVATNFDNEAWDMRLELNHAEVAGFEGAVGFQITDKEFSALGEEAFIDPVDTNVLAAFWVGQRDFEGFSLETGVRVERVDQKPAGPGRPEQLEFFGLTALDNEDFTLFSGSVGLVIPLAPDWQLGLQADYSQRAPTPEELYSFGDHLATQAFEIGDPNLDQEEAVNLAANLSYSGERWRLNGSAFYTNFSDFIYEAPVVDESIDSELENILRFNQEDADLFGVELETGVQVAAFDQGSLWLNAMFDVVQAELDVSGNNNVPRLSPLRFGVGAELFLGSAVARIDYLRVEEQDDVAEFELPTDEYEDLRVYLGTDVALAAGSLSLFLQGKNLTDDEQRLHTSFIKDTAPQPGRTLEAGVRLTF